MVRLGRLKSMNELHIHQFENLFFKTTTATKTTYLVLVAFRTYGIGTIIA